MSKKKRIMEATVTLIFTVLLGCVAYVNDYYKADVNAVNTYYVENEVDLQILDDSCIAYGPKTALAGMIFYLGGKVEHTAYEPLMKALASKGILCVLVEMPFKLAVFDINAADGIKEQYPDITNWYMAGHSLGGSMAAAYLGEHHTDFKGLILLGSYSTEDLSRTDLEVLSVYGSEDKVLNLEKYLENKIHFPNAFDEVVIDGGCHAYFGMYGVQEGDGEPTISNEEQITMTVDAIMELVE